MANRGLAIDVAKDPWSRCSITILLASTGLSCGFWDGSFKAGFNGGGSGFVIVVAKKLRGNVRQQWIRLWSWGGYLQTGCHATHCELKACMALVWSIKHIMILREPLAVLSGGLLHLFDDKCKSYVTD